MPPEPSSRDPSSDAASWVDVDGILDWHAHVYFDDAGFERARTLCEAARSRFELAMGRMHRQPVGPHPRGSCQLSFAPQAFAPVMAWLCLNRAGLTIFAHPNTGDALVDHRDRAIWLGPDEPLDLSVLS